MKLKNKRLLSFVLSLVLVLAMLPVNFSAAGYYVAGDFMDITWNPSAYPMTANGDGTYSITFKNVKAGDCNFKVTDGTWNNSWGDNGQNYTFTNTKVADVTITFTASTKEIVVTGDGVEKFVFTPNTITAVGAGKGGFLNNKNWDPAAAVNHMTNNNGVWSITYTGVAAGTYEFKFAMNDSWGVSWGQGTVTAGKWVAANYDGSNAKITVKENNSTVTLYLDLTAYNDSTKSGAKMKVDVSTGTTEPEEPEVPVIPTDAEFVLFGWINEANHACEENADKASDYVFVDGKLTAKFEKTSYVAVKTSNGSNWYMTDGWAGEVKTVTLHDTTTLGTTADKLMVPAGVELVFTLTINENGTLTLSYVEAEEPVSSAIKYQLPKDFALTNEKTDVRLLTYVDSLDYKAVTVEVSVDGVVYNTETITTVYSSIIASDVVIEDAASVFGDANATHFATVTLTGVGSDFYSKEIVVTVTWEPLEGESRTETRTIVIAE